MEKATMFLLSRRFDDLKDIDIILNEVDIVKDVKGISYLNVPISFDIEVSSFYEGEDKRACMYAFVFGFNGRAVLGRTWDDFMIIMNKLSARYGLNASNRAIIYIHNLAYEFQFIRKFFKWSKVFSLDQREPVRALTESGIEFRCSYLLSGYSLAKVGEHLTKYKVEKMVGDLDYSKIRTSSTPLTDKEKAYILNDGLVVMAYIQELLDERKNIYSIPLTKTGFVRNFCRRNCFYDESNNHSKDVFKFIGYQRLMSSLTISGSSEYRQLKRAFQGGFTHANALYSGKKAEDVTSYDFTSSYPSVMLCERFPMSRGRLVNVRTGEELMRYLNCYCCLFDITYYGVSPKVYSENIISSSKCSSLENAVINNGRVVSASKLTTTITDVDFKMYRLFYSFERFEISNFRIYARGYLPHDFIRSILALYKKKTELKGVRGSESEYLNSKEMLNACYGMTVTDICRDEIVYGDDDEWGEEERDEDKQIEKYNRSKSRFLFYPWGIWVTAYARRNLFSGILELGKDYVYSDTDSIKGVNMNNHLKYIEQYNKKITEKMERSMIANGFDVSETRPRTVKGVEKPIGVWDYDGHYKFFKTLGAKRYIYTDDDGNLSLTVSGVNKKACVPYLVKKAKDEGRDVYDLFSDDLFIPAGFTGKNIHSYIDFPTSGKATDYLGNEGIYSEMSSVHIEATSYSMSLTDEYLNYILGIRKGYYYEK